MHFLQIKETLGLGDNDYLDVDRDLQKKQLVNLLLKATKCQF